MELCMTYLILIFTHFIGDFFFQPSSWAVNKKKNLFRPLFYHSIQHTALFIPVLWFLEINFWWIALLFFSHLAIDSYIPLRWWNKNIRKDKWFPPIWLEVIQDQILHLMILVPIAIIG